VEYVSWDSISNYNTVTAIKETRSVCEALYYFCFLKAYANGLKAYWELSVKRSEAEDKTRDSTPMWNAVTLAETALGQAKFAREEYDNGRLNESKAEAKEASEYLRERYDSIFLSSSSFLTNTASNKLRSENMNCFQG
jgi:hypothetical protein